MLSRRGFIAGTAGAACILASPSFGLASTGAPKRIVSIGSPITEIMFGLGCGERVVAVDQASRFPSATRRKGDAGFHDDLSAQKLLAHEPDLLIGDERAGPPEVMDALRRATVKVVSLRDVRRSGDVAERIRLAGEAIGDPGRGATLAGAVEDDLAALSGDLERVARRRRALILLGLGSAHPPIVGGAGSPAALALEMAGAVNAAGHFDGWKTLKSDQLATLEPEAVVALSIGAPLLAADVSAHPALRASPAVRENRVVVADAIAFTGFGPRAAHVIGDVARAIYPEAAFRPQPRRAWAQEEFDGASL